MRAYKLGVGAYKQQLMIWKGRGITPFPLHESKDAISQGKFFILVYLSNQGKDYSQDWNIIELK